MAVLGSEMGSLSRQLDRRMTRPAGVLYWLDDAPPRAATIGLALQSVAIQSVLFVLPAAIAGSLSPDPADAARFLTLSILAVALWQVLQLIGRGPVGSGYPVPSTHASATIGAYAMVGATGGGFGAAGAMLMVAGAACVALTFVVRRLRVVLPNEVAGVVVILIGVSLVMLGTQRLGLQPGGRLPEGAALLAVLATLVAIAGVALFGRRLAPFAVLVGALLGAPIALALGQGVPEAAALVAGSPWLAWPRPWMPRPDQIEAAPLLAFVATIVALKAHAMGTLVVLQRGSDARWSRPDAPPIRRGLIANGLALMAAGAIGGAAAGPASAAVGLSLATGTLARRIVWTGAAILVVIALCPKLVMLFVMVPEPVKAAMLFYVAGFLMAQGCQLVTARLLDTRRTLIVAFGLCAGIAAAVAPRAFAEAAPALASPLAAGALVALLANLFTLPAVSRRASLALQAGPDAHERLSDWVGRTAGAWALRPQTARAIEHSLGELCELLVERGASALTLEARLAEDRVEVTLAWRGAPLPERAVVTGVDDLMGSDEARQRFALWLATRQAHGLRQKGSGAAQEAWMYFED